MVELDKKLKIPLDILDQFIYYNFYILVEGGENKMPKRMTQEDFENRVKEYTKDSVKVISPYINKRTKVQVQCKK